MQGIKAGLSGYKVYTSMVGSYYWYDFGNAITSCVTAIYNIVIILLDWEKFVYDRHLLQMMIWRMQDDMGIAPELDLKHLAE